MSDFPTPPPADDLQPMAAPEWENHAFHPFALTLMVAAFALGIVNLSRAVVTDAPWTAVMIFFIFVILESVYTTFWLTKPGQRTLTKWDYRAAELIVLLLAARLFAWLTSDIGLPTRDLIEEYLRNPIALFDNAVFLYTLFASLLLWTLATRTSKMLADLSISEGEVNYYALSALEKQNPWADKPIWEDRNQLIQKFAKEWMTGGVFLILFVGLSTVSLSEIVETNSLLGLSRYNLNPAGLLALFVYFMAGFWLLSQARLTMMTARWLHDGVAQAAVVEKSWKRNSIIMLLVVATVAAFLPVGSILPISRIISAALGIAFYIASTIFYIVAMLVFLLLTLFSGLLPIETLPESEPQPPQFEQFEMPPTPPVDDSFSLLSSSLIWTVLIVVGVTAVFFFLRERNIIFTKAMFAQAWADLRQWWRALWHNIRDQVEIVQHAIQSRQKKEEPDEKAASSWRFIRVNSLSPRDQIRYFYLSTVRRATEQGVIRRPDETPLEYVQDLKQYWPDTENEADVLTDAFLEARYSRQSIDEEKVNPLKQQWKQLRSKIKRRRAK